MIYMASWELVPSSYIAAIAAIAAVFDVIIIIIEHSTKYGPNRQFSPVM